MLRRKGERNDDQQKGPSGQGPMGRRWSDGRRLLPSRTRTGAGYDSTAVLAAMIHGLLSGARGTFAAEPLREDKALGRLIGLEAGVPEEAIRKILVDNPRRFLAFIPRA